MPRSAAWRMPSSSLRRLEGSVRAIEHLQSAGDHHQKIVEVMSHSAGELSDGFYFLRLT